jgi:hypothetical protein
MATVATAPKDPNSRGWKNRFMRGRGNSKERRSKQNNPHPDDGAPKEDDKGMARSLSAKRNQRMRKGSGIIRKLKTINNSFHKERIIDTGFPSVIRDESDSSPSNPQSPFSTDSFVTVEVRNLDIGKTRAKKLLPRLFLCFIMFCFSLVANHPCITLFLLTYHSPI